MKELACEIHFGDIVPDFYLVWKDSIVVDFTLEVEVLEQAVAKFVVGGAEDVTDFTGDS